MIQRIRSFIGVLRESKNPLKFILGQVLVKSGLNKYFTIQMNGYKLKFSRSALAVTLFANNEDRHDDEDMIRRILKPGDNYVDIGANIGTLVLTAANTVTVSGKVVAIEAHPATFHVLKQNVRLNGFSNIDLIHSAAGNKQGSVFFSNINSDDQNKVLLKDQQGFEVPVNTLDKLLNSYAHIDLLKIDVEGYEKFVVEGATETLKKTQVVLYESWDHHFAGFGYNTGDLVDIFNRNGFSIYKISGVSISIVHNNYRSINCENLLALKDARSFCQHHRFTIHQT